MNGHQLPCVHSHPGVKANGLQLADFEGLRGVQATQPIQSGDTLVNVLGPAAIRVLPEDSCPCTNFVRPDFWKQAPWQVETWLSGTRNMIVTADGLCRIFGLFCVAQLTHGCSSPRPRPSPAPGMPRLGCSSSRRGQDSCQPPTRHTSASSRSLWTPLSCGLTLSWTCWPTHLCKKRCLLHGLCGEGGITCFPGRSTVPCMILQPQHHRCTCSTHWSVPTLPITRPLPLKSPPCRSSSSGGSGQTCTRPSRRPTVAPPPPLTSRPSSGRCSASDPGPSVAPTPGRPSSSGSRQGPCCARWELPMSSGRT